MFYCNKCADKQDYPKTIVNTKGTCEVCLSPEVDCNVVPDSFLSSRSQFNISVIIQEIIPMGEHFYIRYVADGGNSEYIHTKDELNSFQKIILKQAKDDYSKKSVR